MEYVWGIIFTIVMVAALIYLYILDRYYKRRLHEKDERIKALQGSERELKDKIFALERRRGFRIKVPEYKCLFQFLEFGESNLEGLRNKTSVGFLQDLSPTGANLICQLDLPVRQRLIVEMSFEIFDKAFTLKGKVMRKQENLREISYGIQFLEIDNTSDQQRLIKVLHEMELERRKYVPSWRA